MTRSLARLTATVAAATPGIVLAEAHENAHLTLEMAQDVYPEMTATEFVVLDTNGDGILDARELEALEDDEIELDE